MHTCYNICSEVRALRIQPIELRSSGAETAILYIHGIIGTPAHFEPFFHLAEGFDQYSMLLDGHGGDARDFARTNMERWKKQVHGQINFLLQTHKDVILVAHSMGTLFAILASFQFPGRIKGLFLLNIPLHIRLRPPFFVNCWKVFWGNIRKDDLQGLAAQRAYGIGPDYKVWRYLGWIPRYLELFQEIRRVKPLIKQISVPCVAFQSAKDEMVSDRAYQLLKENTEIDAALMMHSSHFYYQSQDLKNLQHRFSRFLTELRP